MNSPPKPPPPSLCPLATSFPPTTSSPRLAVAPLVPGGEKDGGAGEADVTRRTSSRNACSETLSPYWSRDVALLHWARQCALARVMPSARTTSRGAQQSRSDSSNHRHG